MDGQKAQEKKKVFGIFRSKMSKLVGGLGLLGIGIGLGIALGFYFSDQGVRWFPTTFEVLVLVVILSLILFICGHLVKGSAVKLTAKGVRIRKRVVFFLSLVFIGIAVRMGSHWAGQDVPLTRLSGGDFDLVFGADLEFYKRCDEGIEKQLELLEVKRGMFDAGNERTLTADEEKYLRDVWLRIYDYSFALDRVRAFYEDWYRFDPSRRERSYHLRSFLLTYAAELSLFEKSSRFIKMVNGNSNAVKFLNAPNAEAGLGENSFSIFREQLQGVRDGARVGAGKQYLLWLEKGLKGKQEAERLGCGWLWSKVELELGLIDSMESIKLSSLSVGSDMELFKRAVERVWFPGQKGVAEWMGDTRVHRPGVYLISYEQQEEIDKFLEPGDILLSRKNWYLSNVGLPGFWPHAILYIGSPGKFEEYFDEPEVKRYIKGLYGEELALGGYLEKVSSVRWLRYKIGHSGEPYRVIEAISEGVVLNTLREASGDYLAAMRPRLSKVAKAQAIIEAFGHLDKPYDYNFDFATDHALVCTELVWRSYRPAEGKDGLDFELVDIAGRKTLPANEIAKQFAVKNGEEEKQLDFIYFLDAKEKEGGVFVSTEENFAESYKRMKWSFMLD